MSGLPVLTLKLLVLSFITAKRQLIHNRTAQRSTWNQTYDFVIVGAGTTGCVVANRLTEDPNVTVLLLEAGQPQDALYTDIPNMYESIDNMRPDLQWIYYNEPEINLRQQTGGYMQQTTGRVIGGTSTINAMGYYRGNRRDFNNWVQTYGANGWGYKEVLPFFIKYENNTDWNVVNMNPGYHGTNGPVQITTHRDVDPILLNIRNVLNELGFRDTDINGANQTGTMITQSFTDLNGFRTGAGNSYVDPNPHSNLHIVTRALVIRILFNGTKATGVQFSRNDTPYNVTARREVILCAGPYQTPQLLMLSGIGARSNLRLFGIPVVLDLPVGNNYQNHPRLVFAATVSQTNLTFQSPALTLNNLNQLYLNRTGPLIRFPIISLYFSTKYNSDKEWPNVYLEMSTLNGVLIFELSIVRTMSRGTVVLQSASPYIPLQLFSNLLSDSRDFDNMMDALKSVFYLFQRTSLSQYVTLPTFESMGCPSCLGQYMYECNDSLRCFIQMTASAHNPGGTCRMGALERNDIVIDPNLRVKQAQNLRICDTSIFPELPNSGPEATALMIGEKCSKIIRDCYNQTNIYLDNYFDNFYPQ